MNKTMQPKHQNRFNRTALKNTGEVVRHSTYPCRMNFYQHPPPLEISVEDFERFALDRLQGKYHLFAPSNYHYIDCLRLQF